MDGATAVWLEATRPNSLPNSEIPRPNGLVRAAIAHLWFEAIRPFEDGNGRIGRALSDWVLSQEFGTSLRVFSLSKQINWSELSTTRHSMPPRWRTVILVPSKTLASM
jgi:fido (protein-threonine AMPylation protein)